MGWTAKTGDRKVRKNRWSRKARVMNHALIVGQDPSFQSSRGAIHCARGHESDASVIFSHLSVPMFFEAKDFRHGLPGSPGKREAAREGEASKILTSKE